MHKVMRWVYNIVADNFSVYSHACIYSLWANLLLFVGTHVKYSLFTYWNIHLHAEIADYIPIHQMVIFQPQDTEYNVTIPIIDDSVLEDDEAFWLEVSVPEGEPVTLLQPSHRAVIKILNDDGK